MKQKLRLTETDMHRIIESVSKRILTEGSYETGDAVTWDRIKDMIGAEPMLQLLWNYLDVDQIRDFLDYAKREVDADLGYDDEEDVQEPIDYDEGNL